MIYQAVGYKQTRIGHAPVRPVRHGERTTRLNVALADADHLSQRYPALIWNVETIGASQQVPSTLRRR